MRAQAPLEDIASGIVPGEVFDEAIERQGAPIRRQQPARCGVIEVKADRAKTLQPVHRLAEERVVVGIGEEGAELVTAMEQLRRRHAGVEPEQRQALRRREAMRSEET